MKNLMCKLKHNQFGRTMTEMLGVLAVIGVLSIGGIAGYRLSMNKLRANELIQEMNLRRVALYQQFLNDPDNVDMEMGELTKQGYNISSALDSIEEDVFYINVESIPLGVCKEIMRQNWTAPLDIYIDDALVQNGEASECGTNDTLDLAFKFNKYGTEGDAENENPNPNPDDTDTDTPQETIEETTTTEEETTTVPSCDINEIMVDGTCYSCNQYEPIYAWGIDALQGCPNRTISCSTTGNMDCKSYLTACPDGYVETDSPYCKTGEIPINDGSDTWGGTNTRCCQRINE